jgi:LysM domain
MRAARAFAAVLLAACLTAPGGLAAQDLSAEGWHTVRPGDTLEHLADVYLGAAGRWSEIARLNPEVTDPHRLRPGQRLRVPIGPRPGAPAAQIRRLSRDVDAKPTPIDWSDARLGDLLVERDGVRTFGRSSAEMRFLDGTRLLVTEDSLVFLRRAGGGLAAVGSGGRGGRPVVEIVEGQADVERRAGRLSEPAGPAGPATQAGLEVEIVVGGARAVPRPSASGSLQARARRAEAGSAKVMLYGGAGEVESGGVKVALAEGTGTSVDAGAPPGPPEKLLPAPQGLDPAPGARRATLRPGFSWEPVTGAVSYVVEVCRDAGCGELLERAVGLAEAGWRPEHDLPPGELHWRATARSASGLDGYPAAAATLTLAAGGLPGAAATLEMTGDVVRVGETLYASPRPRLEPRVAAAPECPTERTLPLIDGREAAAWPAAWPPGDHSAAVAVLDRCGSRSESAPLAFRVDAAPPVVRWEIADAGLFAAYGEPRARLRPAAPGRERERRTRGRAPGLAWSADGRGWIPLREPAGAPGSDGAGSDSAPPELRIESGRPQVFLRGAATVATADGELRLGEGQVLRLWVEDTDSGVARLLVRRLDGPAGTALAVEAVDLVGNPVRLEWPVTLAGER